MTAMRIFSSWTLKKLHLSSNLYSADITTKHKSCSPVDGYIESVPPANHPS